jgi:predicted ArsR family transcriptional regulator
MAKPSTRLAVLRLLKTHGAQTAGELAAALGVSAVAVRKHLDALEREGALAVELVHQPLGRPAYRYSLTERADSYFPQRHRELLLGMLAALDGEDPRAVERLLDACSAALRPRYVGRLAGKPLPEQVAELARLREEEGYLTSVERDGDVLTLREYHCPIRDVAERYPAVCRCEQELFRELLGGTIEFAASLREGAPACLYRIPLSAGERTANP